MSHQNWLRYLAVAVFGALLLVVGVSASPAASAPIVNTVPQVSLGGPAAQATTVPTVPPPPKIKNPDTIVEATISEPQSLDPAWDYETAGGEIMQQVYQPLIWYNREAVDKYVGVLATDWKTSPDGKTWTFNIRKGVKFANGDPFNPSDVAYSYIRGFIQGYSASAQWIMLQPFFGPTVTATWLDPDVKPGTPGDDVVNTFFNGDFVAACEAAKKLIVADNNAGTVTMTLKQPWAPFLASIANTWGSIVDQKWAMAQGDWDFNCANAQKYNNPEAQASPLFEKMMGTGPYMLTKWQHGESITLDANPNYWQTQPLWPGGASGAPRIKHVIIRYVPEWGTRFAMLTTGDADLIYVPNQFYPQVDPLVKEECPGSGNGPCTPVNANGFLRRFKNLPGLVQGDIFFNQQVNTTGTNPYIGSGKLDGNGIPPNFFSNIHIRKAFAACFDYNTFIKEALQGEAVQPNGPVNPGVLGYDPKGPKQEFNLDTCKNEFTLASKDPGFQDLLTRGFYVVITYNAGNATRQSAAQILAAGIRQANPKFNVTVLAQPFAVELTEEQSSRLPMFIIGWQEDYHDPNDWASPYLATGGNYSAFQHFDPTLQKQLDTLISQALTAPNEDARAPIYTELNKIAVENALDIFAYSQTWRHYEQTWMKGYYYNPIYTGTPQGGYFYEFSKGQ